MLTSRAEIASDSTITQVMGQNVHASLTGTEEGEYKLDTKSGILLKSNIKTHVKGIQMTGKEIPAIIETVVALNGRKVK